MARLKVGDVVKIVNPDTSLKARHFTLGQIVKISGVTTEGYIQIDGHLAGTNGGWLPSRFELVATTEMVSPSNPSNGPLNDVECKSCHNKKCSSNERTCWLCGFVL